MTSFILRKRTWYRQLLDVSAEMALPDIVLAEQLLASANPSSDHQLMIRTALHGDMSFDKIADELLAQHGRIHEKEKSQGHGRFGSSFPRRSNQSFHGKKGDGSFGHCCAGRLSVYCRSSASCALLGATPPAGEGGYPRSSSYLPLRLEGCCRLPTDSSPHSLRQVHCSYCKT